MRIELGNLTTETALLDQLIGKRGLLSILGWTFTHSRPARIVDENLPKGYSYRTAIQGTPGFPDILAAKVLGVGVGRVIFAELKAATGKATSEQIYWLDLLTACWQETYLWLPSDFEEIQEILTLNHQPNLIERAELKTAWINRRMA